MCRKAVFLIVISILLCGCKKTNESMNDVISLRNRILECNGCSFLATVTADYDDKQYIFSMDCKSDKEGMITFSVTKPDTIAGITGQISSNSGSFCFDDKILAFPKLADGEITPVTAPWVFLNSLSGGYIRGCSGNNGSNYIEIDDSYEDNALRVNVYVENYLPISGEIFWNGRRVISITVENFIYL